MTQDHQLANQARQELKRQEQRQEILASQGARALDLIMEAPSPATLVQSFPDQDLYYLMHKIGVHDFIPVLAMASSRQWEYILDVEVWAEDRLDLHLATQVFDLLFQADPKRLLRWTIMTKPQFMELFLFSQIQVKIREHDELPPEDHDDYFTLDDKFYFRFPARAARETEAPESGDLLPDELPRESLRHDEAPDLIESMFRTLAEMDLSVFHGLLQETCALLPAEAEEEEFRLRNVRLAEKGFLPPHQAVGIYQPAPALRRRPGHRPPAQDLAGPPQFFTQYIQGDLLFVQALKAFQPGKSDLEVAEHHNELAALVNKVISADRVKLRKTQDMATVVAKVGACLSLGLEKLMEEGQGQAVQVLESFFLEDIFRTGSREGISLKQRALKWYDSSFIKGAKLPLSFLGESFLGVLGGLFIERPMFFANYAQGELYRHFRSMADVRSTGRVLDQVSALDSLLTALAPDLTTFTLGVLSYKSLILTLWAKAEMDPGAKTPGQRADLSPIPLDRFTLFFAGLFQAPGQMREEQARQLGAWAARVLGKAPQDLPGPLQSLLFSLIQELEEEYGNVDPGQLDPRFIPHFLVESRPGTAAIGDTDSGDLD